MDGPRAAAYGDSMKEIFGEVLRRHRQARRLSQLALSLDAGVSTRHLSYIETSRAQPSREMVLTLASALNLSLREQNELLLAAGYAPRYPETPLGATEMNDMRRAIELLLRRSEPFGAVALDSRWNVIMANESYARIIGLLTGEELRPWTVYREPTHNALRSFFQPGGIRRAVANWEEVARSMISRLVRERERGDPVLAALVEEVLAMPGVPRPGGPGSARLVIPLELDLNGVRLRLFTTIATIGTPQDITLEELRIESFHPADEVTEVLVRQLMGGA